ncbi:family 16 glycosylhydrolase [Jannaschia rubra]|uniref:family 16 glycosylhydrolase n=1 Tax=Jannaschia rubra TaxID=282197 RepID=UPI0024929724|nr:family 16 glycosylhydrolase [Jannaschia rubra]
MAYRIDDSFDTFDTDFWNLSDFALAGRIYQAAWNADHVELAPGTVTLRLTGDDKDGKPFTGAEIQSSESFGYGSYEMRMQPSGEAGVVSAFFLFTSDYFGATRQNEIDFEFLGRDSTEVRLNYFYGSQKLAAAGPVIVDLGFDASAGMHDYRIEWMPDGIRWFVDDRLVHEVAADGAPVPQPDEDMLVYGAIWTGGERLENWHGPIDADVNTTAVYDAFSYTEAQIDLPVDASGAVTFAGTEDALVIDMDQGTWARAARVLAIGDSLTEGFVDVGDPNEDPADRDGYRSELFDGIVAAGGWFDYVGFRQTGPSGMIDRDHSAVGGKALREIVASNGSAGAADLSDNLDAFAPDVVLLMAGTNDYNNNAEQFFSNRHPAIMSNMNKAIDQFLAMEGSADAWLVISTIAPKIRQGIPEEFATFINEGYSTVGGQREAGDAGNGTFVPGLRALVEGRGLSNVVLFDNPLDAGDLSPDEVHFTDAAYTEYADALSSFLQSRIGLEAGTLDGDGEFMQVTGRVVGGEAGDRIIGSAGSDVIEGGAGSDYIDGRGGADTIVYRATALDGNPDVLAGFKPGQGDRIDLSGIASDFGWSVAQTLSNLVLTDVAAGVRLAMTTGSGVVDFATVLGQTASGIAGAITVQPQASADDDGNLALSAPDATITGDEAASVALVLSGLDADAIAVIRVTDGTTVLTRTAGSDGTYLFDISGLLEGSIATSVTATDAGGASLTLPGDTLSLIGDVPDTSADEDGNLALGAPDLSIDADEVGAVVFAVSGIDADASAVVTVTDGSATVTSAALDADGSVTLDLSGLGDGTLSSSVTATDAKGNTATVAGPGLTLDTAPSTDPGDPTDPGAPTDPDTQIVGTSGEDILKAGAQATTLLGLGGGDKLFGGSGDDVLIGGAGADVLRGGEGADTFVFTMDDVLTPGDDLKDFDLSQGDRLEFRDILSGFDGSDLSGHIRIVNQGTLGRIEIDADGGGDDFAMLAYIRNGRGLDAAQMLVDGGLIVTAAGEVPDTGGGTPDTSADEDGNLALGAPDLSIDADEVGAVVFAVSGIDADASAVVTVTDGSATVTSAALDADGSVTLDLSGLGDGTLSSSVTATDAKGNTATVAGPGLTLDTAPSTNPGDPTDPGAPTDPDTQIVGTSGEDILKAGAQATTLLGLGGGDKLFGGSGDDVLIGGAGADVLRGGEGADTFVFTMDDVLTPGDDLKDFDLSQGDRLEFRDILSGFDGSDLSGHIRIVNQGTLGRIEIDADGGGDDFAMLAYIRNGRGLDAAQLWADGDILITG